MTAESKWYRKAVVRNALSVFTVLAILAGLFLLSKWADRRSGEVEGPSRLIKGPQGSIYVQIDRSIAKVSSSGELLTVLDLDTQASVPDAADFFVEEDGRLLFARYSGLLQHYSPEGKLLNTLLTVSLPAGEDHSCSLTRDPSTGIIYFADTSRNRILLFGRDGKELRTITVPSGSPSSSRNRYLIGESDLERIFSPDTPLQRPRGLTFAVDRLIAADTGNSRIVLFNPDGTLDKVVPVFPLESSNFLNPLRADRVGDTIYVVVRSAGSAGGRVQAFEFNTGLPRDFRYSGASDPRDVLARSNDVLVADRASLTVLRYAHTGRFLGTFGKEGLLSLYAESQFKRETYQWLRKGAFAGMAAVLGWLIFSAAGRLAALGNVPGSSRAGRKMLLLIPGLGQAAAGRPLRAGILLLVLLYFVGLFVYSVLRYRSGWDAVSLPVLMTAGFMLYSVWISIVLDGIRLTRLPGESEDAAIAKPGLPAVFAPAITVFAAALAQLARELIVQEYPGAPSAVQQLFYLLLRSTHAGASLSEAGLPASLVFGWGGAIAALFGTLAWEMKARREELAAGIVVGFLTGVYGWLFTVVIAGSGLGWTRYAAPVQGILLGLSTWLFFRGKGMPVLVIAASVAGAWMGYFLRFFSRLLSEPLLRAISAGDAVAFWTAVLARLELILIPALFIHLAVWITWLIASERPAEAVEAVLKKEDNRLISSGSKRETAVRS